MVLINLREFTEDKGVGEGEKFYSTLKGIMTPQRKVLR